MHFQAGIPVSEIGIIAPYRNQVKLVQKTLTSVLENQPAQTVEVNTVDQFQGRDKDVIIVTFVRSQSPNKILSSSVSTIIFHIVLTFSMIFYSYVCVVCHLKYTFLVPK